LYEAAVRGFYASLLPAPWKVATGGTYQHWPLTDATEGLKTFLPVMKTDTLLQTPSRRIIVETKFADALKSIHYGASKLSEKHIYQLYAYVQSQHGRDELSYTAEGVLLYPVVAQALDESATIQGHRYRFLTVDLAGSAAEIRTRLLSVPLSAGSST
jgi:5-methylcytosine-specific restriction enzyme subunit McrC